MGFDIDFHMDFNLSRWAQRRGGSPGDLPADQLALEGRLPVVIMQKQCETPVQMALHLASPQASAKLL